MNNPTQQIKQMARNLFKAKAGSSYVKILHPKRDWLIGVGIAFCILLGITVWNGYTYFANRDGGTTDIEITITNPRYQAELVSQALNQFETRAVEFTALSSGVSGTPTETEDPVVEPDLQATTTRDIAEPDTLPVAEEGDDQLSEENSANPEPTAVDPESDTSPTNESVVPTLSE